jgi:FMN reductase
VRAALLCAEREGAETFLVGGEELAGLPHYRPDRPDRTSAQLEVLAAVRRADGLILGTPTYHGGVSGLVKNAIDLLEDLRDDPRPYLEGRTVGCIVTTAGWQGAGATLQSLRTIVHALRGWPTPYGVTINTTVPGAMGPEAVAATVALLSRQVVGLAPAGNRNP